MSYTPGPNVNAVDQDGLTALAIACKEGSTDIAFQLIAAGAYVNLQVSRFVDRSKCVIYRVFAKGRNEVGPSKSLIFWTFSDVLGFFRPFNIGDFSLWYFWDI